MNLVGVNKKPAFLNDDVTNRLHELASMTRMSQDAES